MTAGSAAAVPAAAGLPKEPGAVLLISCYELGHQPLGLASPIGFLQQAGFTPAALDLSVDTLDENAVRRARLIAIAVPMHTAMRLGVGVAERVRALNPHCHLCFYGLYATLNAEYLLQGPADSVIGGECEAPLVALAQALDRGGPVAVDGVVTRGRQSIHAEHPSTPTPEHPAQPFLQRLAFVPAERDGLPPLERYARLDHGGELRLAGYAEASRGCKHHCRHCPIPPVYGGRFFVVPPEVVLDDVRRQVAAGARHITFGDPDFLNGPGHALRVVRAVHGEFPLLTFDFTTKIEHILKHPALFPEFAALGCVFIVSAVESVTDPVLEQLRKGHTRADVVAALAVVREAGITLRPSLMPFTPWATLEDYLDLLEFTAEHDLVEAVDPVQYTIRLLVPPGSSLLDTQAMVPYLGSLDPASFSYRWTHPDPRMDRLQAQVAVIAERGAADGEDPRSTYARIREAAYAAAGRGAPPLRLGKPADQRPPRLTESWFC